jgi:hypothetical protein
VSEAPSAPKTTPTISDWSKPDAGQPVEVANAPDRAAVVVFDATKGGYVLERGGQSRALPREWFGVGPPRRDVSISADGKRLAIPDGDDVVIYDTDTSRWMARIKAPQPGAQGKVSADGRHVRWSAPGKPCSMTEIATGTLQKTCP